ncbi:hypothetical protein PFISCL1PPCAC_24307, partial [Pristionchus fissidentatus]
PYVCIRQILSYLHRDSLDVMEIVSKRIYQIATEEPFNSVRRKFQSLKIKKFVSCGFHFCLQPENKAERSFYCLIQTTSKNHQEHEVLKYHWTGDYHEQSVEDYHQSILKCSHAEIMQNVFEKIQRSLRKNSFVDVFVCDLHLSNFVIDEFEKSNLKVEKSIQFVEVDVSKLTEKNLKRFTNWVLSLNVQHVSFTHAEDDQQYLFDEHFIKTFAKTQENKQENNQTMIEEFSKFTEPTYFTPSKNILEYLCRFKILKLPAMKLNSDWILELIS